MADRNTNEQRFHHIPLGKPESDCMNAASVTSPSRLHLFSLFAVELQVMWVHHDV